MPFQPLDEGIKVGDLLSLNRNHIWIEESEMNGWIFFANCIPVDIFFYTHTSFEVYFCTIQYLEEHEVKTVTQTIVFRTQS